MRLTGLSLLPAAALVVAACAEQPAGSMAAPSLAVASARAIRLQDQCDATTFNAALGAGTCTSTSGGVRFDNFIALLTATQSVGPWRITPPMLDVAEGATLPVLNTGGEEHTYTEVEEFGGGIVPQLNQLSGNTAVAPECTQLQQTDFLSPGEQRSHTFDEEGAEKYQCCIHPWMRQVVHVRASS